MRLLDWVSLLAQTAVRGGADPSRLYRAKVLLLVILVILILLALLGMLLMLRRRGHAGRRADDAGRSRRRKAHPDPWVEAGRRIQTDETGSGDADHDTVDIDPSELSRGDIEPDSHDDDDDGDDDDGQGSGEENGKEHRP